VFQRTQDITVAALVEALDLERGRRKLPVFCPDPPDL
jgi:hypothetical protein